jgi:hypothetical protein
MYRRHCQGERWKDIAAKHHVSFDVVAQRLWRIRAFLSKANGEVSRT